MINVSMEGVKDAVDTVKEIVVPWSRNNAHRKANLENAQRQAEIQRLNAETLIAQAKLERERAAIEADRNQAELIISQARKTKAEATLLLAQAEKTRAEAEKERAALRQSQIELAMQIIERYASELSGTQKIDYVIRLLPTLERLLSSRMQLGEG